MTCPVCGEQTKVTESRDFGDHVIRRRKCVECDYVFFTEENDSKGAGVEYSEFHAQDRARRRKKEV